MSKQRIYNIGGKKLVLGDPNLITSDSEILVKEGENGDLVLIDGDTEYRKYEEPIKYYSYTSSSSRPELFDSFGINNVITSNVFSSSYFYNLINIGNVSERVYSDKFLEYFDKLDSCIGVIPVADYSPDAKALKAKYHYIMKDTVVYANRFSENNTNVYVYGGSYYRIFIKVNGKFSKLIATSNLEYVKTIECDFEEINNLFKEE